MLSCPRGGIVLPEGGLAGTAEVSAGSLVAVVDEASEFGAYFLFLDEGEGELLLTDDGSKRAVARALLSGSVAGSAVSLEMSDQSTISPKGNAGVTLTESLDCAKSTGTLTARNDLPRWCRVLIDEGRGAKSWLPGAASLADRSDWVELLSNLLVDSTAAPGNVRELEFSLPESSQQGVVLCGWARPAMAASFGFSPDWLATATAYYAKHSGEITWAVENYRSDAIQVAAVDAAVAYWAVAKILLFKPGKCEQEAALLFLQWVTDCVEQQLTAWDGGAKAHAVAFSKCGIKVASKLYETAAGCAIDKGQGAIAVALRALSKVLSRALLAFDAVVAVADAYDSALAVVSHDVNATWDYPVQACLPECGDDSCSGSETCASCSADCGACAPKCGDNSCNGGETCASCAGDCGACPPKCGDNSCNGSETCTSCVADCGACSPKCGDGTCTAGQESCPDACGADCCTRWDGFSSARSCVDVANGVSASFSGDVLAISVTNAALDSVKVCTSDSSFTVTQASAAWPLGNYGTQVFVSYVGLEPGSPLNWYASFKCSSASHVVAATGSNGGEQIVSCSGSLQRLTLPAVAESDGTFKVTIGFGKNSDTTTVDYMAIGPR